MAGWKKLDSQAGQASVTLHLDLGQSVPSQFQHVRSTARDRRRQRRADARNASENANMKNTLEKDEEIQEINADTEKVEAYRENAVAVEKTDGLVVEKSAEDAEKL